jgi:hypothetical protein
MLLLNIGNEGDEVMVALCINLATDSVNAQQMMKKNRVQSLMMRAFNYQDNMLMKMLRNLSEHKSSKSNFVVKMSSTPRLRSHQVSIAGVRGRHR